MFVLMVCSCGEFEIEMASGNSLFVRTLFVCGRFFAMPYCFTRVSIAFLWDSRNSAPNIPLQLDGLKMWFLQQPAVSMYPFSLMIFLTH